jgi:Na+-transporting NADH:ubiquinone oxidoreductase subunit D
MGRCEGYARNNQPWPAFVDGLANGLGYTFVLLAVAFVRELLGFGSLFGVRVLPDSFTKWTIMVMAPAAFFVLGTFIWIANTYWPKKEK